MLPQDGRLMRRMGTETASSHEEARPPAVPVPAADVAGVMFRSHLQRYWLAVKELETSYQTPETISFTIDP